MTSSIFSKLGDVDEMLNGGSVSYVDESTRTVNSNNSTDNSQQVVGSGNQVPVGSGNDVDLVGDIATGDLNIGNIAGNGVSHVVGNVGEGAVTDVLGVEGEVTDVVGVDGAVSDVVGSVDGGVMGTLGDVTGTGDLTSGVQDVVESMTDLDDVTAALPLDTGSLTGQVGGLMAPVTGVEGPVSGVVGDLTGDLAL